MAECSELEAEDGEAGVDAMTEKKCRNRGFGVESLRVETTKVSCFNVWSLHAKKKNCLESLF